MDNTKILNIERSCTDIPYTKYNKMCRACLKQEGIINLFKNKHKDLLFSDIFTLFSLFQAEQEDGFPQSICQDCANFVTLFYSFKQTIIENHIILQLNKTDKESFENGFFTTKIKQSTIDSPDSDNFLDVFNSKVNNEITNDNFIRLTIEDNRTLLLDHDYAKVCNDKLVCPCCFLKFSNKDEFISHRISEVKQQTESNGNIKDFTCLYCNLKFNSRNGFLVHMKRKSEERKTHIPNREEYTCPKCKLKFNTRSQFLKHRREERVGVIGSPPKTSKRKKYCKRCNIKFNTQAEYIKHKKEDVAKRRKARRKAAKKPKAANKPKVTSEREYTCLYCSLKFYSKHEYIKHRKEEAKKKSLCPYCKKVIHTSRFDNHLRLIHKKLPPLKCDICKNRFLSSTYYKKHILAHRDGFFCEICGRKCFSAHALTCHKKSHDREKTVFTCEICGKTFRHPYLFKEHMYIHTGEKPLLCSACGATFNSKANLNRHTIINHTERPFKCELCGNSYGTKEKLNRHIQRHEDEKNNVCNICGKEFLTKPCLNLHLKNHDRAGDAPGIPIPEGKTKKVQCLSCNKDYRIYHKQYRKFQLHIRTHLGESPYLCLFCGKQFNEENKYNIHSKLHGNRKFNKLHECYICFKRVASNTKLTVHMSAHTGERPFKCNLCGKSFLTKQHLKRHLFCHTGEKPFSCKYCEKTFTFKNNCMTHERTHQGSGNHICSLCGKSFYTGSSLRKHQQRHISNMPIMS